jgi:hypothetical protein
MPAEGTIAYKPVDHITPWESNPNLWYETRKQFAIETYSLHSRWDKGLDTLDKALKRNLDIREVIYELKKIEDKYKLLHAKICVVDESLFRLERVKEAWFRSNRSELMKLANAYVKYRHTIEAIRENKPIEAWGTRSLKDIRDWDLPYTSNYIKYKNYYKGN